MEAIFDNKANILDARIRAAHHKSILYTLRSNSGFRGRKATTLQDANPPIGSESAVVGVIHWQEKMFEVHGQKKRISEIKRHEGGFFARSLHWQWSADRNEYQVSHRQEEWKATLNHDKPEVVGRFSVPFRPHLFSKSEPARLQLTRTALTDDEVFLILVFIYSEVKRRDKTNSSSDGGVTGW